MRILFILSRFPWPLNRGDRLICYHRLRTLGKNNEITVITFYQSPQELKFVDEISIFCKDIYPIYFPKWKFIANAIKCLADNQTVIQSICYTSKDFQSKLNTILHKSEFDLVHYFLIRMAEYKVPDHIPKVIELIDSMQLNLKSRLELEKPLTKVIFKEELRRLSKYEKQIVNRFHHSILVSEKDRSYFDVESNCISIIPNGIDFEIFKPVEKIQSTDINIIFSGHMGYRPNVQAVQWFVNNCWDTILKKYPNTRFIVAGVDPTKEILDLRKDERINVTGAVESMAVTIASADISIVPMQSGSGMQNKVLEAMACGIPVIATTLGLGTIKAVDGESILVADTPNEFVSSIISLIEDQGKRESIGNRGLEFVRNNHSWEAGAEKVQEIYQQVLSK